jgi:hypothetical protein
VAGGSERALRVGPLALQKILCYVWVGLPLFDAPVAAADFGSWFSVLQATYAEITLPVNSKCWLTLPATVTVLDENYVFW